MENRPRRNITRLQYQKFNDTGDKMAHGGKENINPGMDDIIIDAPKFDNQIDNQSGVRHKNPSTAQIPDGTVGTKVKTLETNKSSGRSKGSKKGEITNEQIAQMSEEEYTAWKQKKEEVMQKEIKASVYAQRMKEIQIMNDMQKKTQLELEARDKELEDDWHEFQKFTNQLRENAESERSNRQSHMETMLSQFRPAKNTIYNMQNAQSMGHGAAMHLDTSKNSGTNAFARGRATKRTQYTNELRAPGSALSFATGAVGQFSSRLSAQDAGMQSQAHLSTYSTSDDRTENCNYVAREYDERCLNSNRMENIDNVFDMPNPNTGLQRVVDNTFFGDNTVLRDPVENLQKQGLWRNPADTSIPNEERGRSRVRTPPLGVSRRRDHYPLGRERFMQEHTGENNSPSKNKIKSGILDTADSFAKEKLIWPQKQLGYKFLQTQPSFDQLQFEHLVLGELCTISSCEDLFEAKHRLRLLQRIAYWKMRGAFWPQIRSFYAAILSGVEAHDFDWDEKYTEIESMLIDRPASKDAIKLDRKNKFPKKFDDTPWFCKRFNTEQGCDLPSGHTVITPRGDSKPAMHICSRCYRLKKQKKEHSECSKECPEKL